MAKVVPPPGSELKSMAPPWPSTTMALASARALPRTHAKPVLVVKNGSKDLLPEFLLGMPGPVI